MKYLLKGAYHYDKAGFTKRNILIEGKKVFYINNVSDDINEDALGEYLPIDLTNKYILPGLCDVHVHFRQPGFSYKETIYSGSRAAAAGGFTTVCAMPNLNPVPDCLDNLKEEIEIIERDSIIKTIPYGSITKGQMGRELSDMEHLAPYVIGFSDDGRDVADGELMEKAMEKAKKLGKIIAAHCEDEVMSAGGVAHEGAFARANGLKGISSLSEYSRVLRDIELAEKTGCSYHVCHVSTKESVKAIKKAKARGVDITCETAPHYLILSDEALTNEAKYKMKPPIRSESDRLALLEGLAEGVIDMIATDHAPHSASEKAGGFAESAFGVVGLEVAFSACYTHLVKTGIIPLKKLVRLMSVNPVKRFPLPSGYADFSVFDLDDTFIVNPDNFISLGASTPFEGEKLFGKCLLTIREGKIVYRNI